jgi:hypothetical protein
MCLLRLLLSLLPWHRADLQSSPPLGPIPPPPTIRVFDLMDKKMEAVLHAKHNVDPAKLQDCND